MYGSLPCIDLRCIYTHTYRWMAEILHLYFLFWIWSKYQDAFRLFSDVIAVSTLMIVRYGFPRTSGTILFTSSKPPSGTFLHPSSHFIIPNNSFILRDYFHHDASFIWKGRAGGITRNPTVCLGTLWNYLTRPHYNQIFLFGVEIPVIQAGCVVRVEVQQLMVNGTAAVSANLCNQEIAVMKGMKGMKGRCLWSSCSGRSAPVAHLKWWVF